MTHKADRPSTAGATVGISAPDRIASPASTGGAGTFFEQHVDAYWLAQLLVRSIPPILLDCTVLDVHLQTEHLGWHTDDFLVVGQDGAANYRRLAGQAKRSFNVSAADDECRKAIQDFWRDFRNPGQFAADVDRLALVTLRGTNTLLEHFSGLLDCARASRDGEEFERRLATPGFVSAKAVEYCGAVRAIVGETEGRDVSASEIWPFLRVLHVLSLDLNSSTGQTEAMIKTLLAHTAGEQGITGVADATWNALLAEVGEGMPQARTYRRDDLPEALRQRHSPLGDHEQRALRALDEHSSLILGGIRSTIGGELHLQRSRLVHQVIAQSASDQIVLITGPAGSGKSGVARDAIDILARDHFTFAFRAEEFEQPHLDQTLQGSQVPANAATLGAILAGQDRKVLLVESVERLLEASTRDAFTDLLTLLARDTSWRLILTCRDYSADLVRTCFLEPAGVGGSVVSVPLLDDEELAEVSSAYPVLARPLADVALRRLLRNPYALDKALQIQWSEDRPLPQSERDFRALFWQDVVRVNHRAAGGMPRRRHDIFVAVALRRARTLRMYAPCGDLDPEVMEALRRDSLVLSPHGNDAVAAPAHDVLEDWAILRWVEEQYALHEGSLRQLSGAIGAHPAVRRTYRKWVTELADRDSEAANGLFQAALLEGDLPAQFRDDTLVSVLRSSSSADLLARHSVQLFANDRHTLRRVIHLLRVGCVVLPDWVPISAGHGSVLYVPDGRAWASVLSLVEAHLSSFVSDDRALILGLIEDWARGVSWQCPYPEGARSAAAIAHWLLQGFDDYRSQEQRKRVLRVIAKIPAADDERFRALLLGGHDKDEPDRTTDHLRDIILKGVDGMPTARDMPQALVSATKDYLLCSEADLRRERHLHPSLEREPLFGIKPGRSLGFFPASACRGPFLPLLRHHPREGLALIIDIFSHSVDWLVHPRLHSEHAAPLAEMRLTFADGTSRTQWCNAQLWSLYRGTASGPYVLASVLMALERWLLEYADVHPDHTADLLLHLLRQSDCAALTAVVASVATAFPHACGEALLVLLRSPLCIRLDRQRLVLEAQAPSRLASLMPGLANDRVYESERKEADELHHRAQDLEAAVINLQMGPFAPRVHEILDQHRADMPPVEEHDESDRLWRLAMHRMDLRRYRIAREPPAPPAVVEDGEPSEDDPQQYVRIEPEAPEPDVQDMVDSSAGRLQAINASLGLLMWGVKVFSREEDATYDPGQWRQRLQEARSAYITHDASDEYHLNAGGPGHVAAICVRDHWEDMLADERAWCVDLICTEVARQADQWTEHARAQRFAMSADRPCAMVVPLLLGKVLESAQHTRVHRTLAVALTHAIDQVRDYAASGIGANLWTIDRDLALRCVNALAKEAALVQQRLDAECGRPYDQHRRSKIEAGAASLIRQQFREAALIAGDAYESLDTARWYGAEANHRILNILAQAPSEPSAIAGFSRLAQTLCAWWDWDDDRRHHRGGSDRHRSVDAEIALASLLSRFLLRVPETIAATIVQPILGAVDAHPREVHQFVRMLIAAQDTEPNAPRFWAIWRLFADRVRGAKWLDRVDDKYGHGREMVSAIFLAASWKEGVRHWRCLDGHVENIHTLLEDLPGSSTVLESYLRFLYDIGEQSLPDAFIRVAGRLEQGDPRQMIASTDAVFMLEALLQRFVYGRPLELKRQADLRDAVLYLLDLLVEIGSSAAFRMRDDFVTPVSAS